MLYTPAIEMENIAMVIKECSVCGNKFEGSNRSKYCSARCKYGTGICKICGNEFVKTRHTTGDYCSPRCWYNSGDYKNIEYRECSKCGMSKDISEFPYAGGKGKKSSWCKQCHANGNDERQRRIQIEALKFAISDFSERLRNARISSGATQGDMAKTFSVDVSHIRRWEKGTGLPRPKTVHKIFEHFGWKIPIELLRRRDNRLPLGAGICENCGNEFPIYQAGTKFCSRICNNKYHSGERNSSWRGGKYPTGNGYIKVKDPNHPNADSNGYVLEHVLVMTQRLGRPLVKGEHVHHKNGKRGDNQDDNLELWTIGHKDPAGVRVTDKVVDDILVQPEIVRLSEEIRGLVKQALSRVIGSTVDNK